MTTTYPGKNAPQKKLGLPNPLSPDHIRYKDYSALADSSYFDGWIVLKRKEIIGRIHKEESDLEGEHNGHVFRPIAGVEDHWQVCSSDLDHYEYNGDDMYPAAIMVILETLDKQEGVSA